MKSLKLLGFSLLFFVFIQTGAQTPGVQDSTKKWSFGGKPGLKWSRNSFNNWALGGLGNTAIEFDSEGHAYYKTDVESWKTDLFMAYGFNRRDQEGKRKIVDRFDLRSHYSRVGPNKKFRYSGMFHLKSQFTNGYEYRSNTQWLLQSGFFAPGYVKFDFGVDYIAIKHLTIHLSPLAEKATIVSESYYNKKVVNEYYKGNEPEFKLAEEALDPDDPYQSDDQFFEEQYIPPPTQEDLDRTEDSLLTEITYGLAWRETSRFETGAAIQVLYDHPQILKNIDFKTRLDLFASYSDFFAPDVDWELWLSFNFNKYIAFTVNTQLMYDADVVFDDGGKKRSKLQFRDFVGIGVSYTFKK